MNNDALPVTLYGTMLGWLTGDDEQTQFTWDPGASERWGVNSDAMSANLLWDVPARWP